MSSSKIQKLKTIFTANGSCGCKPKAKDIIEPKPKSKTSFSDQNPSHCYFSSDSSTEKHGGGGQSTVDDEDNTSTTFSLSSLCCPEQHDQTKCSETVSTHCPKIQDSFAVVKDSDDPYQDFRQSMLQMILEKEIYSINDLQQLLDCFLKLNSPHHQEVIIRAFMEIWNGIPAAVAPPPPSPCSSTRFT